MNNELWDVSEALARCGAELDHVHNLISYLWEHFEEEIMSPITKNGSLVISPGRVEMMFSIFDAIMDKLQVAKDGEEQALEITWDLWKAEKKNALAGAANTEQERINKKAI